MFMHVYGYIYEIKHSCITISGTTERVKLRLWKMKVHQNLANKALFETII